MKITEETSQKIKNMSLVCALLVVFIHIPYPTTIGSSAWMFHYVIRYGIAPFAVPFFFVASGFLLAGHCDEPDWWRAAVRKRFRTLLVPFLCWLLLREAYGLTTQMLAALVHHRAIDFASTCSLGHWTRAIGIHPWDVPDNLWYVRMLMILVLTSPLIIKPLRRAPIMTLAAMFAFYYCMNPGHAQDMAPWSGHQNWCRFWRFCLSVEGLFYFSCGIFLRRHPVKIGRPAASAFGAIGLILIASRMLCKATGGVEPIPMVALTIPFVLIAVWELMPVQPWPSTLTSLAFPIYVCHDFFCSGLLFLIKTTLGEGLLATFRETTTGLLLFWAATVCGSITLAICLRRFAPRLASVLFGGRS